MLKRIVSIPVRYFCLSISIVSIDIILLLMNYLPKGSCFLLKSSKLFIIVLLLIFKEIVRPIESVLFD